MKIQIGKYKVLSSGTVIQVYNEPIEMTIEDSIDNESLKFIMKFADDKNEKDQITNFNVIDSTTLEVTFLNFNNTMGIGNTEIIHLGTLENKNLYFNYRIYHINNIGKTLHYTFYLGEEVING